MTPPPIQSEPHGAILLVAPSQTRAGVDLLRSPVAERPVAMWALAALRDTPAIGEIVLLVEPERVEEARALVVPVARLVGVDGAGANTALRAGLDTLSPSTRQVVVLEASRPLVTPELLATGIATFQSAPGLAVACASFPLKETIKGVRGGVVVVTLDRSRLALLSTPMIFARAALEAACRVGDVSGGLSQLLATLRASGGRVATFPSGAENLAVATADDLALADRLLRARRSL